MGKINIEKLVEIVLGCLTEQNTGSFVYDKKYSDDGEGWTDDYFQDADNVDEVLEEVKTVCQEFNNGEFQREELYSKLGCIEVEWDTNPISDYKSFKDDKEILEDELYNFKEAINDCIGSQGDEL